MSLRQVNEQVNKIIQEALVSEGFNATLSHAESGSLIIAVGKLTLLVQVCIENEAGDWEAAEIPAIPRTVANLNYLPGS